jgi:N-carbamoyl-L-amino-acid hydrolase
MNRRDFNSCMAGAFGSLLVAPTWLSDRRQSPLSVNGERLQTRLQALAEFGKLPSGGCGRVAFSDADRDGRNLVMELMRNAGLEATIDAAGNIIGRRAGTEGSLPPIMFGSHIDSVPEGGNFDGPLGTLAAIEVAQVLSEHGKSTRHPLEVVAFQNEEAGKTGSRAMIGSVTDDDLALTTHAGKTIRDGIQFIGGDPTRLNSAIRQSGDIAVFLELHIEQGAVLETEGVTIGVVEGIVGIKRWNVIVDGAANHAGTTPMAVRHDALLTAGRFIDTVNRVITSLPGQQVGTVGQIEALPGAPNVVPGRVNLSLEIRDLEMAKVDRLYGSIAAESAALGELNGTTVRMEQFYESMGAPTDENVRDVIAESASELGLTYKRMPSGAGHDAQSIAKIAPVGMIFIPSEGGISHSPLEYSRPEHVVAGANVLLHTILKLDAAGTQ